MVPITVPLFGADTVFPETVHPLGVELPVSVGLTVPVEEAVVLPFQNVLYTPLILTLPPLAGIVETEFKVRV